MFIRLATGTACDDGCIEINFLKGNIQIVEVTASLKEP